MSRPKPTPATTLALACLVGKELAKMGEKQLCEKFAETTAVASSAFRINGKIRYYLEEKVGKDAIYAKLAAHGIESDDVSNAGFATNAYRHLVMSGQATEEEFDKFSFHLCRAISRVAGLSAKSPTKKTLPPDQIMDMIRKFKSNAQKNFECIAEHGVTLKEHEAAVAKAAEEAAAAAAAEAAKNPPAPATTTTTAKSDKPGKSTETAPPGYVAPSVDGSGAADDDTPPERKPESKPSAPSKPTAASVVSKLEGINDDILAISSEPNSLDEVKAVYAKMADMLGTLAEYIASQEPAPAPAADRTGSAGKGKNGKDKSVALAA